MVTKIIYIVRILINSALRRLFFDIYREITIGICCLVLIGLFYYMFADFFNVRVKSLSKDMYATTTIWLCHTIFLIVGVVAGRFSARLDFSLFEWLKLLGEKSAIISFSKVLWIFTSNTVLLGVVVWLIDQIFPMYVETVFFEVVPFSGILWLVFFLSSKDKLKSHIESYKPRNWQALNFERKISTMIVWRYYQILFRNPLTQIVTLGSLSLTAFCILSVVMKWPMVVSFLLALVSGFLASLSLPLQLKEDLTSAWAERSMGVSHNEVVFTYFVLGTGFSLILGSIGVLGYCLVLPMDLQLGVRLFSCFCISPLLMPALLFQVDARRPIIQIAILFIGTLFLGTALIASVYSVIILPLLSYYLMKYQSGLYYRA